MIQDSHGGSVNSKFAARQAFAVAELREWRQSCWPWSGRGAALFGLLAAR